MKQRELRYKISKKAYSRVAFPKVSNESTGKNTLPKMGKVYRAPDFPPSGRAPAVRSAQTRSVCLGYCAIRNFKEILKRWSDNREQLHQCLNGFIEAVTDIVGRQGGVAERFSANGILFGFGHERADKEDLKNAIVSALKIRYRMNKLNRAWDLYHEDAWKIGIGVIKGTAMVMMEMEKGDSAYTFRGNLPALARGLGSSAGASQVIVTEETYKDSLFPKDFIETQEPYHVQIHGTDYMTRVREIVAMSRGQQIL